MLESRTQFFLIRIKAGKQAGMFIGESVAGGLLVRGTRYSLFDQQGAAFRFLSHTALPVRRKLANLGFETELILATAEEKRKPNKAGPSVSRIGKRTPARKLLRALSKNE